MKRLIFGLLIALATCGCVSGNQDRITATIHGVDSDAFPLIRERYIEAYDKLGFILRRIDIDKLDSRGGDHYRIDVTFTGFKK